MLERTIRIKRRLSTFQMIALDFAGVILLGAAADAADFRRGQAYNAV